MVNIKINRQTPFIFWGTITVLSQQITFFIDQQLGMGAKLGYQFTVYVGESACVDGTETDASEIGYLAVAWPDTYGETGKRSFCVDQSGTIRGLDISGAAPDCSAVTGTDPWPMLGN